MKKQISLFCRCLTLLFCVLIAFPRAVFAADGTESLPNNDEARMQRLVKTIEFQVLSQEPPIAGIVSFDVAPDGRIALGLSSERVCVYSSEGVFLFGYSFDIEGASYEVLWNKGNVVLYFHRSDTKVTFDRAGNCIEIEDVAISPSITTVTVRQVNGVTYKLERDIPFGNSYARLCIVQPDGVSTVFYDATSEVNTSTILATCGAVLFLGTVIPLAIRRKLDSLKKNGTQEAI